MNAHSVSCLANVVLSKSEQSMKEKLGAELEPELALASNFLVPLVPLLT
jgi:hypothetical protein